ncbi:hypothetical protein [Phormidium sp. CCY1219]|uniref:hypothetical protein n=1 Tax=Phormidium sp. CCY1219 TaxID=2886104 RepID=UPI002D1F02D8|nr:hypothetical protein [Phormidium sp. CCY1219]MEB3830533.1 hypothetical protein [Phormidium sp. CCY1219]
MVCNLAGFIRKSRANAPENNPESGDRHFSPKMVILSAIIPQLAVLGGFTTHPGDPVDDLPRSPGLGRQIVGWQFVTPPEQFLAKFCGR